MNINSVCWCWQNITTQKGYVNYRKIDVAFLVIQPCTSFPWSTCKKIKQSNYEADGTDLVVSLISSSLGLIKSSYFEYVVMFRDSTSSIYLCVKLNCRGRRLLPVFMSPCTNTTS